MIATILAAIMNFVMEYGNGKKCLLENRRKKVNTKKVILKILGKPFQCLGYDLDIRRDRYSLTNGLKCYNVGAGEWECSGWINLDYPSEWYAKEQAKHPFISYDIRSDNIPINDGEADMIYCSHVIEHIEDKYVIKFFEEAYRSLRKGGVFRITCPDADFLYDVTQIGKNYWNWRKFTFDKMNVDFKKVRAIDCLVHEIATPRLFSIGRLDRGDYIDQFNSMDKEEFLDFITEGLVYDVNYVGDHINYWTLKKLRGYLVDAGFTNVILSKYQGSSRSEMQNAKYFDITHPYMSIYVEAIK